MSHREPEAQARPPTPSSGCLPRVSAHGLPGTVTPPSTACSVRSCGHFSVSVSTSDGMFTAASLWGRQGLGGGRGGQLCVLAPGRVFFVNGDFGMVTMCRELRKYCLHHPGNTVYSHFKMRKPRHAEIKVARHHTESTGWSFRPQPAGFQGPHI